MRRICLYSVLLGENLPRFHEVRLILDIQISKVIHFKIALANLFAEKKRQDSPNLEKIQGAILLVAKRGAQTLIIRLFQTHAVPLIEWHPKKGEIVPIFARQPHSH